jgi:hypothetical protein
LRLRLLSSPFGPSSCALCFAASTGKSTPRDETYLPSRDAKHRKISNFAQRLFFELFFIYFLGAMWFTKRDVRRQLAALGYFDVPEAVLEEFTEGRRA